MPLFVPDLTTFPVTDKGGQVYNVVAYGGKGDQLSAADGAIAATTAVFTSASAAFAATDVGKTITVMGAGAAGVPLTTTILSWQSATQVTLNANAATTVVAATYYYGTDNTALIAAAIAAIPAAGGTLFFPPGTYRTSQLTPASNTTVAGVGAASIIDFIDDRTTNSQALYLNAVNDCVVRDLTLQSSNASGRTGVYGHVRINNCQRIKVLNCRFGRSSSTAVHVIQCTGLLIQGNTASGMLADGIHITRDSHRVRVIGNDVSNCGDDMIAVVAYNSGGYATCSDITIMGNTCAGPGTGTSGSGISIVGANDVTVVGNTVLSSYTIGINVGQDGSAPTFYPYDIVVAHNTIRHAGYGAGAAATQGINIGTVRGVQVLGNQIDDTLGSGIFSSGVLLDCVIAENVLSRIGGRGIDIEQVTSTNATLLTELYTNLGETAPAAAGVDLVSIVDNTIRHCGFESIYVLGSSGALINGLDISGNRIRAFANTSTGNGIYVLYAADGTLAKNRVLPQAGGAGGAIRLDNCARMAVTGNACSGFSSQGIYLSGTTSNCILTGNVCNNDGNFGIVSDTATATNNSAIGNECTGSAVAQIRMQGAGEITRDNRGYNPVGVVTPAVPASTVAVAAVSYDRTFYVTTGLLGCTMTIQDGPAVFVLASAMSAVRVPAGKTVTPTYTNAPTWVVEGE